MNIKKNTATEKHRIIDFSKIEQFHPYKAFLFIAIIGSTVLFMSFSFLYFLNISRLAPPTEFVFPKIFTVSTVLLLLSSFSMSRLTRAFKNDSFFDLKALLISTIALTIGFSISQFFGIKQIYSDGFLINEHIGASYLYLLTGIHFVHVFGGLLYLSVITTRVFVTSSNLAKTMLFFSDQFQLTRLQLIEAYWHFIDLLWIFLFFIFLFTL